MVFALGIMRVGIPLRVTPTLSVGPVHMLRTTPSAGLGNVTLSNNISTPNLTTSISAGPISVPAQPIMVMQSQNMQVMAMPLQAPATTSIAGMPTTNTLTATNILNSINLSSGAALNLGIRIVEGFVVILFVLGVASAIVNAYRK